ncbi:MAG TPA: hypothetical protein PLV25_01955 [Opitutales bacterium]|nr:hypothetical protein [Opitutales bacterium]
MSCEAAAHCLLKKASQGAEKLLCRGLIIRCYKLVIAIGLLIGIAGVHAVGVPCERGCGGMCYAEKAVTYGVPGAAGAAALLNHYLGPNAGKWIAATGGVPSATLCLYMHYLVNNVPTCKKTGSPCLEKAALYTNGRMAAMIALLASLGAGAAVEYYNYHYGLTDPLAQTEVH